MSTRLSHEGAEALALVATEWFKTARRLEKLTATVSPSHAERERALLIYSHGRIAQALADNGLRLMTHEKSEFSPAIPAEPVNPEDFDTDEGLVVSETLEPTVIFDGKVLARGRVVLAKGT